MFMLVERASRYLLPGEAERDETFRSELLRLGSAGLRAAGAIQIGVAVFMLAARLLIESPATYRWRLAQGGATIMIGALLIFCARMRRQIDLRPIAIAAGLLIIASLSFGSMVLSDVVRYEAAFIPAQISLVLLVGVIAMPFRPMQTLLFGLLIAATYSVVATVSWRFGSSYSLNPNHVLFVSMLTLLATALSALLYEQRRAIYELRVAEARHMLAENAASVGRLAAALSHELNSPVGALVSGVDTLLLLAARQATSPPDEQHRLVVLQNDLRRSIKASTDRLREVVARMQRFTNLDKGEIQVIRLREVLEDVVTIMRDSSSEGVRPELRLDDAAEVVCRPQQLSAAFANLVGNAVHAATDAQGRVLITSAVDGEGVRVDIEDNGRGLDESELKAIFDPGFKVTRGRVGTGNWSMFSSRQIVREHGGDIVIQSRPGTGTCVRVTLPLADASPLKAT